MEDNESFHVVTRTGFRKIHSAVDSDVLAIMWRLTDTEQERGHDVALWMMGWCLMVRRIRYTTLLFSDCLTK